MKLSDGGKGSAPRQQQDQDAYEEGHKRIFGMSKLERKAREESEAALQRMVEENERLGLYDEVERELQYKQRCNWFLAALVGSNLVDNWWGSPNKAFDGRTPAGMWLIDYMSVYNYLMNAASGDYQ